MQSGNWGRFAKRPEWSDRLTRSRLLSGFAVDSDPPSTSPWRFPFTYRAVQELFEIFSDEGAPAGLAARNDVHRLGLWYRASNVFLFRTDGRLVIQRRHRSKDVWPDAWDLSVAEHLKPGETFLEGAIRGLREEFGIEGVTLKALSDEIRCRLEVPESGIKAYELQVCYHRVSDADLACDFDEVAAIRFVTVDELEAAIRTSPHEFTPSLRDRARDIGLFERLRNG